MQTVETAQNLLAHIEKAIAANALVGSELQQLRQAVMGKHAPELEAKAVQVIDPAWFKNQTNRHLTTAGKAHLRHLLVDLKLNKNQAAVAMGIEPAAVAYWWKRWGLGSSDYKPAA